jgi:ribosomal protein L10
MRIYKSITKSEGVQIRTAVKGQNKYRVYKGKTLLQALKQADLQKPVYLR